MLADTIQLQPKPMTMTTIEIVFDTEPSKEEQDKILDELEFYFKKEHPDLHGEILIVNYTKTIR